MKIHGHCPSCLSDNIKVLKGYEDFHLYRCQNCHLAFSNLIPEEDLLSRVYDQYGRNDYLSPITVQRYRDLLTEFESFRQNNKLLDIGCGNGFFLDEALKSGWKACGTEYADKAIKINEDKGIKMFRGDLSSIDFGDLKFDVITSFEVLEHLPDPASHLKKLTGLLRKGGLLYLTTPNFDSLNRRLLKNKWNVISYPEHLCYFNKKSLNHLMEKSGMKKQKLSVEGISPGRWIKSRRNESMDFSDPGSGDEKLRNKIEKNSLLKMAKRLTNYFLNLTALGENLKARYIKL